MTNAYRYSIPENGERGVSLIEVMIAATILSVAALAVYPIVLESKKMIRRSDFQDACITAARAKLHEYVVGLTDLEQHNARTSVPALENDTQTGGSSYRNQNTARMSSQFAFAKARYNARLFNVQLFDQYCPHLPNNTTPVTLTQMPPRDLRHLGREECVSLDPNTLLSSREQPQAGCQPNSISTLLQRKWPGLKIFVNLKRHNALIQYQKYQPPIEDCAWDFTRNRYDFLAAGDGIKITVTGVYDLATNEHMAGITRGSSRMSELTCQVSQVVKPYEFVARYWLQSDGRIYRWLGNGTQHNEEVFRSLASPANKSILVAPDNKSVFMLRANALTHFTECGGYPLDCDPDANRNYEIDSRIAAISGKYTLDEYPFSICARPKPEDHSPTLFAMFSDRTSPVCLSLPIQNGGQVELIKPSQPEFSMWPIQGAQRYGMPFVLPSTRRVHSFFMDATGLSTYFVSLGTSATINSFNGGAIYNSLDIDLRHPVEVFNVRAISFSK